MVVVFEFFSAPLQALELDTQRPPKDLAARWQKWGLTENLTYQTPGFRGMLYWWDLEKNRLIQPLEKSVCSPANQLSNQAKQYLWQWHIYGIQKNDLYYTWCAGSPDIKIWKISLGTLLKTIPLNPPQQPIGNGFDFVRFPSTSPFATDGKWAVIRDSWRTLNIQNQAGKILKQIPWQGELKDFYVSEPYIFAEDEVQSMHIWKLPDFKALPSWKKKLVQGFHYKIGQNLVIVEVLFFDPYIQKAKDLIFKIVTYDLLTGKKLQQYNFQQVQKYGVWQDRIWVQTDRALWMMPKDLKSAPQSMGDQFALPDDAHELEFPHIAEPIPLKIYRPFQVFPPFDYIPTFQNISRLNVYDLETGKRLKQLPPHIEQPVWFQIFQGNLLAVYNNPLQPQIRLLSLPNLETLYELNGPLSAIKEVAWDEGYLYTLSEEGLQVWNIATGKLSQSFQIPGCEMETLQNYQDILVTPCRPLYTLKRKNTQSYYEKDTRGLNNEFHVFFKSKNVQGLHLQYEKYMRSYSGYASTIRRGALKWPYQLQREGFIPAHREKTEWKILSFSPFLLLQEPQKKNIKVYRALDSTTPHFQVGNLPGEVAYNLIQTPSKLTILFSGLGDHFWQWDYTSPAKVHKPNQNQIPERVEASEIAEGGPSPPDYLVKSDFRFYFEHIPLSFEKQNAIWEHYRETRRLYLNKQVSYLITHQNHLLMVDSKTYKKEAEKVFPESEYIEKVHPLGDRLLIQLKKQRDNSVEYNSEEPRQAYFYLWHPKQPQRSFAFEYPENAVDDLSWGQGPEDTLVLRQNISDNQKHYTYLNINTGQVTGRFKIVSDGQNFLFVLPEGYFAGLGQWQDLAYFREGAQTFPLTHFKTFHRPDLVWKALQGKALGKVPSLQLKWEKLL